MKKIKLFLLIFFAFVLCQAQSAVRNNARAQEQENDEEWRSIAAQHATIFYHPDVDIDKVSQRIKIRFSDIGLDKAYYSSINKTSEGELAEKFDRIVRKVQRILDMYPRKMRLKVKLYKNQSHLDAAYAEIFGRPNSARLFSFYIHKYSTLYITQQAVRPGVIAHEVGHAVVDHYFLILPPEAVGEILSQYVEIHLED